jgi:hypothetical protein
MTSAPRPYPLLAKVAEPLQKRGGGTVKSQSAFFELTPRPLEKPGISKMFFKSNGSFSINFRIT